MTEPIEYLGWTGTTHRGPDGKPVEVRYHFARVDGRAQCCGIDIRAFHEYPPPLPKDPRPIPGRSPVLTATEARRLPLARLMDTAHESHRKVVESSLQAGETKKPRAMRRSLDAFSKPIQRQQGRPRAYGREHFELVARVYSETKTAKPNLAVAIHFGVSPSAAAKWIRRAKDMGLIREAASR